jgi:hypothetical protein
MAVGGFKPDEFVGWGGEDNDLYNRYCIFLGEESVVSVHWSGASCSHACVSISMFMWGGRVYQAAPAVLLCEL